MPQSSFLLEWIRATLPRSEPAATCRHPGAVRWGPRGSSNRAGPAERAPRSESLTARDDGPWSTSLRSGRFTARLVGRSETSSTSTSQPMNARVLRSGGGSLERSPTGSMVSRGLGACTWISRRRNGRRSTVSWMTIWIAATRPLTRSVKSCSWWTRPRLCWRRSSVRALQQDPDPRLV